MGKGPSKFAAGSCETPPELNSEDEIQVIYSTRDNVVDSRIDINTAVSMSEANRQERKIDIIDLTEGSVETTDNIVAVGPNMESTDNLVAIVPNMGSTDNFVAIVPNIESTDNFAAIVADMEHVCVCNRTGNAKSNIQKNKTGTAHENSEAQIETTDVSDHVVDAGIIQNNSAREMTVASVPERKSLKRRSTHPPTSEMVLHAIKALKKRYGATFKDISTYIDENYEVEIKRIKHHAEKFLKKSVEDGVLEQINTGVNTERFKIKKIDKQTSGNVPQKNGKLKLDRKMAGAKKQVKK